MQQGGDMAAVRRHLVALTIVAMVCLATGSVSVAGGDDFPGASLLDGVGPLLEPVPSAPRLPGDPAAALASATSAMAARLDMPVDVALPLVRAQLHPGLAGRLAVLLEDLGTCHDATGRLLAALPAAPSTYLAGDSVPAALPGAAAIRACAARVQSHGLELSRFLATAPADMGQDVALWPVLRLDLDGTDDVVVHDYVLSVDQGGDDAYFNSAGGNPLDLRRGPTGSSAPQKAPSRGCVNPSYDLGDGQCTLSAALLVDLAGDDTYGRIDPPDPKADGICTDEPLVHRVLTAGAGFAGAGILLDGSGNDQYLGKATTQGAGHVGGVGILRDGAGDDVYHAMRMSKGFGTVFGEGILADGAGNDRYTYYMPRALDPNAPYKTPGSGGGLTTTGLCDNQPRWDEGSGLLGGTGVLVDDGGADIYQAAAPVDHLLGTQEPLRRTGSLGFGDGGLGLMFDRSGRDSYAGMPGRADDVTVMPSPESMGIFNDSSGGGAVGTRTAGGGSALVLANNMHFVPRTVTIDHGSTLQFLNPDSLSSLEHAGHTLTEHRADGGPARFNSALVEFGSASPVAGVPDLGTGRYDFFCEIHPFMRGVLTVR
jgi:plastocyanin